MRETDCLSLFRCTDGIEYHAVVIAARFFIKNAEVNIDDGVTNLGRQSVVEFYSCELLYMEWIFLSC